MRAGAGVRTISSMALAMAFGLSGCVAAVPVAVAGAGSGINFTSTTAYRSFTYSKDQVHASALQALERMQIVKTKDEKSGDDIEMQGKTKHLTISITLTAITPAVTKASVNARRNWFMKDQTVAAEILIQMDQVLRREDSPH